MRLFIESLLEIGHYVGDFLLDLKLDSINMVFNWIEVLFFLFLPFEESLYTFQTQNFLINSTCCFFLPVDPCTQFFDPMV